MATCLEGTDFLNHVLIKSRQPSASILRLVQVALVQMAAIISAIVYSLAAITDTLVQ